MHPILALILTFILIGFAYGPSKEYRKNISQNNSSISKRQASSQDVGYTPNKYIVDDVKKVEDQIKKLDKKIDERGGLESKSIFSDKISMSSVTNLNDKDPNREYIRLSNYLGKNETLNITGWYLRSEKSGYTLVLGGASLLPFPFSKNYSDVVLQHNDKVIIVKGFSPIGISFRTNKCVGYFEEYNDFTPSLENSCPLLTDTDLPQFSSIPDRQDECVRAIDRVGRCKTVSGQYLRDLDDTVTSSCKAYMEVHATYNACVAKHFGDTDFPGNTYYIYLNKFGPLWRENNEKINLYDRDGFVVDSISW
jgi:hypothetical protein